ncbi:phosphatase PAP2 family protein [Aliihoeflea sp. 40Bstr573]|uniref:phosphatase PAP2 family protein n=1 Tax=Aliihoeflea sp. 40Bstr573 TaxID=2696467 RepID=UPI002096551D|nr:hypothetical protein [Aliihoeflea sp. 40Bstr573]
MITGRRVANEEESAVGATALALKRTVAGDKVLFSIAVAAVAFRLALLDNVWSVASSTMFATVFSFVVASILILLLAIAMSMPREGSLAKAATAQWRTFSAPGRIIPAICAMLALSLVMNSFAHFKASIPQFNPYEFDALFAEIDRILHFNNDPWRILDAVLGYGVITKVIDYTYYAWFLIFYTATGYFIWAAPDSVLRRQYLIAFAMIWTLLGIVAATAFASVGPIFYDDLAGGPSTFTDLMRRLVHVDEVYGLSTMVVKNELWSNYQNRELAIISGISAMPSLHNAICILLYLAARRLDRRLGYLAAVFAVVIFIGSVHLGWHYAIDAYASLVAVTLIWKAAGLLARNGANAVSIPQISIEPVQP